MKFSQIAKGTRAVRQVELPLVNMPCPMVPDLPELAEQRARDLAAWQAARAAQPGQAPPVAPDATVMVGLRVLRGDEQLDVLEKARALAVQRHAEPKDGDPIYDLGRALYTLELACVDPDATDPDAPEARFFDSADQILKSEHIGRDGIAYLYECQELWQDECSPQALKLSPERFEQLVDEVAGSATLDPLVRLRPGTRAIFTRTLAALLRSLQQDKSRSSSDSGASSIDGSSERPRPNGQPAA